MDNTVVLHPDMPMRQAFDIACQTGQYLISDGKDVRISATVPHGWRELATHIKNKPTPPLTA